MVGWLLILNHLGSLKTVPSTFDGMSFSKRHLQLEKPQEFKDALAQLVDVVFFYDQFKINIPCRWEADTQPEVYLLVA